MLGVYGWSIDQNRSCTFGTTCSILANRFIVQLGRVKVWNRDLARKLTSLVTEMLFRSREAIIR